MFALPLVQQVHWQSNLCAVVLNHNLVILEISGLGNRKLGGDYSIP